MCRLFGIMASRPVDLNFSLVSGAETTFGELSRYNPHGWGIGWYENEVPEVRKEPLPANRSGHFRNLASNQSSSIYVCHIRYATHGGKSENNCHPFTYKNWMFAHNGSANSIFDLEDRLDDRYRDAKQGETDSELYFLWLLQNIEEMGGSVAMGVGRAVSQITSYSALNFILSDGEKIFAYRDGYELNYLVREPAVIDPKELRSSELKTLIEMKTSMGEAATLVCSEPLTEEDWEEVPDGCLLTISRNREPEFSQIR